MNEAMKKPVPFRNSLVATAAALGATSALALPPFADVVVLMDESGSMSGEQVWMAATIPTLDSGLVAKTLTPNRYGLIGFGASAASDPLDVRAFPVGGAPFGTAAEFTTASGGLVASGSYEDGYAAIALADSYAYRGAAARNYILVSDEDRDASRVESSAFDYASTLASLKRTDTLLNVVVNASFQCGDGSSALGIVGTTGYKANGSGGFSKCGGASFVSGFGTTGDDYVSMALATGGGAWDLNVLRSGGDGATSFTAAFIDGKIAEIINPPVPEPSTYALMALGLGVVGWLARRRPTA